MPKIQSKIKDNTTSNICYRQQEDPYGFVLREKGEINK